MRKTTTNTLTALAAVSLLLALWGCGGVALEDEPLVFSAGDGKTDGLLDNGTFTLEGHASRRIVVHQYGTLESHGGAVAVYGGAGQEGVVFKVMESAVPDGETNRPRYTVPIPWVDLSGVGGIWDLQHLVTERLGVTDSPAVALVVENTSPWPIDVRVMIQLADPCAWAPQLSALGRVLGPDGEPLGTTFTYDVQAQGACHHMVQGELDARGWFNATINDSWASEEAPTLQARLAIVDYRGQSISAPIWFSLDVRPYTCHVRENSEDATFSLSCEYAD